MDRGIHFLGQIVEVIMDRPMGARHPRYGFEYPVNYGYVPDTRTADGEEMDAYVLGVSGPRGAFRGRCIAVIERLAEIDDKLVIVPPNTRLSDEEIREQTHFQEQFFESRIVRTAGDHDKTAVNQ